MRISETPKEEDHTGSKAAMEGISPGQNMSSQTSTKLGQYECNSIQFTIV
jgi:hypothetical protein